MEIKQEQRQPKCTKQQRGAECSKVVCLCPWISPSQSKVVVIFLVVVVVIVLCIVIQLRDSSLHVIDRIKATD